jgi:uncharacterized integral membrane protein (TIGR00698 family)
MKSLTAANDRQVNPSPSTAACLIAWDDPQERGRIAIPWFALGFVAVAGLNSLALFGPHVVAVTTSIDTVVLAMAMAALGLTTHVSAIRTAGVKPLALGALIFAWLIGGGIVINFGATALLFAA